MTTNYRRSSVELTHTPTGERVRISSQRTQRENYEVARSVLRSRLWARENGYKRPGLEVIEESGPYMETDDAN